MISDGLTALDEKQNVIPSIAEKWETPDKGKTWIFTLKPDIYWHDDERLVSSDIDYNFDDVEVIKPDNKTIKYVLKEPFSPFPSVVSRPVFKRGLLGTDSWKVKTINFSENVISNILLQSDTDKINYKFYPTEQSTKVAYKLGEIDQIDNLFDPSPFDEWDNSIVTKFTKNDQVVTLFFNTQDEFLSDKTVRQSLNYAIDKKSLGSERAIGPISKKSWAYNPIVKNYEYDPKRASEILDEIVKEGGNPTIKLVSAPALLSTAELIKDDWEKVGLEVNLQVSAIIPTEYQAFLAIFDLPKDPDQYTIWHSTQKDTNISGYTNPRIDKLLEDGRTELDQEVRKKIYFDFQRFLLEDSPAVFLYYPEAYSVKRK
jgi:peptide/nickel transport system substrate-binding protein